MGQHTGSNAADSRQHQDASVTLFLRLLLFGIKGFGQLHELPGATSWLWLGFLCRVRPQIRFNPPLGRGALRIGWQRFAFG